MIIFLLLGILFFPSIIADEIKISENGSIHWIRYWEEGNTQMIYKIESPLTSAIGKLEKETKIEGCQHIGGCNIILRFGDGTVFYEEKIDKNIDKIIIDLGLGQGQK